MPDVHMMTEASKVGVTVKCGITLKGSVSTLDDVTGWTADATCPACTEVMEAYWQSRKPVEASVVEVKAPELSYENAVLQW